MWETLMMVSMLLTALALILLVLVQRGKGGGLAGALGGMGGQSAFGTKAGDMFTKITIGVASFWIILCVVALGTMQQEDSKLPDLPAAGGAAGMPAGDDAAGNLPASGAGDAAPVEESE